MKNDPIEAALAQLDAPEADLAKALSARSNLVAAKAARLAGSSHRFDLIPALAAAFDRFLKGADKGCAATLAIARALVTLDHDDHELFGRGMKHVQREPVWGGSVDSAADLRAACAIGLVNTRCPNKLRRLIDLLVDPESAARSGAVRAITAVGSESAALLLRYKAHLGDEEPDVCSDCIIGLLEIEGAEALPMVRCIANSRDTASSEPAILALGASRRPDAINLLMELFEDTADREHKSCILLALATSRTDPAVAFLRKLAEEEGSEAALNAMKTAGIERLAGETKMN